jgi:hypothetical protein
VAGPAIRVIKRNCSASPRQLAGVFVAVVAVSFAFGVAGATLGLWMVLSFVGLELRAVVAALIFRRRYAVGCGGAAPGGRAAAEERKCSAPHVGGYLGGTRRIGSQGA